MDSESQNGGAKPKLKLKSNSKSNKPKLQVSKKNKKIGIATVYRFLKKLIEEGKIHLDDHHTLEEQFDSIISKLRPIIPLKIEQKQCVVIIPAIYAGKSYQSVKDGCKVLQEEWKSDGSWQVKVEMPAGRYQDFIDKLNSLTHGEVEIKEV